MQTYSVGIGWWISLGVILLVYAAVEWWHMRHDHAVGLKEATVWTIIYVGLGILYAIPIFLWIGSRAGTEYLSAFFTEKALSLDNLFVFGLIFASLKVPKNLERRILNYGVVGAIIFRLIFIIGGIALLQRFEWVSIVFGVILLRATWHALQEARGQATAKAITETRTWHILTTKLPLSRQFHGHNLLTMQNGKRLLTMLAATIVIIELTDILFAVDSVPAVLAISTNRFIVFSSNILAILGLRALYFVYAGIADRLWALQWGITIILGWISLKLLTEPLHIHTSQVLNLSIILGVLLGSALLSFSWPRPPKPSA
jgi:tellurite resistance protein TerC